MNTLLTLSWVAKEAVRSYVNNSVSQTAPNPLRVEHPWMGWAEVRDPTFPAAKGLTLHAPDAWCGSNDPDEVIPLIKAEIIGHLRTRGDYDEAVLEARRVEDQRKFDAIMEGRVKFSYHTPNVQEP